MCVSLCPPDTFSCFLSCLLCCAWWGGGVGGQQGQSFWVVGPPVGLVSPPISSGQARPLGVPLRLSWVSPSWVSPVPTASHLRGRQVTLRPGGESGNSRGTRTEHTVCVSSCLTIDRVRPRRDENKRNRPWVSGAVLKDAIQCSRVSVTCLRRPQFAESTLGPGHRGAPSALLGHQPQGALSFSFPLPPLPLPPRARSQ